MEGLFARASRIQAVTAAVGRGALQGMIALSVTAFRGQGSQPSGIDRASSRCLIQGMQGMVVPPLTAASRKHSTQALPHTSTWYHQIHTS
eukprot:scaffold209428_cov13-Tisochrysis_lutea.AAC.2